MFKKWKTIKKEYFFRQGGITCGAIDEPRKSSKAIDERVILNFCDKNVVIARIRNKNGFFILFIYVYVYISIYGALTANLK